jgi:hypothetical protein
MLDKIEVQDNLVDFERKLTRLEKKDLPFATAVALTRTVQDAQGSIIQAIPHIFKTTKKWWLPRQPTGVKIKGANFRAAKFTASVFTKAYFAALQEEGGIKTPHRGKLLAVPTQAVPKSRRKSGGARKTMSLKSAVATRWGVYLRKGGKKNPRLEKQFTWASSATVPARFGFKLMADKVARRRFRQHLDRELAKAVAKTKERMATRGR